MRCIPRPRERNLLSSSASAALRRRPAYQTPQDSVFIMRDDCAITMRPHQLGDDVFRSIFIGKRRRLKCSKGRRIVILVILVVLLNVVYRKVAALREIPWIGALLAEHILAIMNGALYIVAHPLPSAGKRSGMHRLNLLDRSSAKQWIYQINQITIPHAAFPFARGTISPGRKPRANLQKVTILAKCAQYLN
jgi:hypothetical protein